MAAFTKSRLSAKLGCDRVKNKTCRSVTAQTGPWTGGRDAAVAARLAAILGDSETSSFANGIGADGAGIEL
ncbi:hypothetical protein CLV88_103166 [Shimia abyssi]|uniref:Uncharacterized protein n=1 Tax=Shimia abyssi TaxID=1662395 RepID=A0A2P8FFM5_9RHOB|nr:hypothetical protein CLV88_103166 [Shimia abyssi]